MISSESIIDEVIKMKDSANNYKKRNRYAEAIKIFSEAIDKVETFLSGSTNVFTDEDTGKLKDELADCYGQIGGIYKRWAFTETNKSAEKEKLKLAYEAYDKGYEFEIGGSKITSYNLLNRLVLRIFFNPEWINSDSVNSPEKKFLRDELVEAQKKIQDQMRSGREDIWGWADVGLITLLLNPVAPIASYDAFLKRFRTSQDYKSLIDTLKPLSSLPIDAKENIGIVIDFLEKNMS